MMPAKAFTAYSLAHGVYPHTLPAEERLAWNLQRLAYSDMYKRPMNAVSRRITERRVALLRELIAAGVCGEMWT